VTKLGNQQTTNSPTTIPTVLVAFKVLMPLLNASWLRDKSALAAVILLHCSAAVFKIQTELTVIMNIGIRTVITVKDIHKANMAELSSTKNLEQGRTKDINQTEAMTE